MYSPRSNGLVSTPSSLLGRSPRGAQHRILALTGIDRFIPCFASLEDALARTPGGRLPDREHVNRRRINLRPGRDLRRYGQAPATTGTWTASTVFSGAGKPFSGGSPDTTGADHPGGLRLRPALSLVRLTRQEADFMASRTTSRALSSTAANGPTSMLATGVFGVDGWGRVGAAFLAAA